jgi:16S rRNA (cytosine967-C5)-methyltransferase
MSGNVRGSAARVLCLVEGGGFADAIIDGTIRREGFENPSDASLLTELVMGTLRNRLILDEIISKYLSKSIDKTDEFVRNALRIGVYQMLFLSRIPPHAALNETIEAVKRKKGRRLAGFANGVLRNVQRDLGEDGLSEIRISFPVHVQNSIPTWMVSELRGYFDEERLEPVLKKLSSRPPSHVRVNTLKANRDMIFRAIGEAGVAFSPHPVANDCLILDDPPPLHRFRPFLEGLITPQDAGSVLVTRMVADIAKRDCGSGGKLLDACSAPGIKTSYLRSMLPGWEVWATDVSGTRIQSMKGNFDRMGVGDVTTGRVDFTGSIPENMQSVFDVVFVDSPCSGLGVMRRNPEVKWRIGMRDIELCAEKSAKILENALRCVKEGGCCLYSTCTFTGRENEEVVKTVSRATGCVVESVKEVLPHIPDGIEVGNFAITAPDLFDCDFFFLARIKKEVA